MLEKLSQEQEILMYATKNEYLKKFFSLPKLNKKKATEYIKWLYQFSNLKEPNVLFVDSPMACQVACNILQVKDQVMNQVWDQVWDQVMNQVGNQVRSQVGDQVRSQVGDQVMNQVWDQVRSQVGNQVRSQVYSQVKDQNLEYFNFGYYADYSDFGYYADYSDFGWISFYDFFTKIGILDNKEFNEYKKLVDTGIFMIIQTENYCIVSAMPTKILREGEKMHNPNGYAIEFKDGYGQHYLYGIYFEPELFEKIKTMTAKDVVKIKNIEQRMALLKLFGAEKILNELGADLIDKSERGNELYSITGLTDKTEKILKYECPSTGRVYTKFVEPRFEKADEAQAWSHHFTIEEYSKLKIEA
jgi:hypothetical protein